MIDFGTAERPLRPSSLYKLLKCPMSVLLSLGRDSPGNKGAQTGNLFHHGIEGFHRAGDDALAGQEALDRSVESFPEGDYGKASRWYQAYAADEANQGAVATLGVTAVLEALRDVGYGLYGRNVEEDLVKLAEYEAAQAPIVAVELPVRLVVDGVHIYGTLDQIRKGRPIVEYVEGPGGSSHARIVAWDPDGFSVWDAKTGSFLKPDQTVAEYQTQQASYVLAARHTYGLDVHPGGIIYASGYDAAMGRRLIPTGVDLGDCEALVGDAVKIALEIRSGARRYTPSADGCNFCPHKPFPQCKAGQ